MTSEVAGEDLLLNPYSDLDWTAQWAGTPIAILAQRLWDAVLPREFLFRGVGPHIYSLLEERDFSTIKSA